MIVLVEIVANAGREVVDVRRREGVGVVGADADVSVVSRCEHYTYLLWASTKYYLCYPITCYEESRKVGWGYLQ